MTFLCRRVGGITARITNHMGFSPHAAAQMLACKEPRTLKINIWSDTLKLIRGSSEVIWESVSNHTVNSCHKSFKDGKYLVTSP